MDLWWRRFGAVFVARAVARRSILVLMFKILVLQALYSLSDEATEFQIKDRLSFQRLLGLGLDGTAPDATTVWLFRERLVKANAIDLPPAGSLDLM